MQSMHRAQDREAAPSPAASPSPSPASSNVYSPVQMKNYLDDLRSSRPARPTGSRPPPKHFNTWSTRTGARVSAHVDARPSTPTALSTSALPTTTASPEKSIERVGRPLARPPTQATPEEPGSAVGVEEEVFESARDEAAELVWKHRNPQAVPSPSAPYAYPGPRVKKSAPRSRSIEPKDPEEAAAQNLQRSQSKRKRHSLGSDDATGNKPEGTAPTQDAIAKAEQDLPDSAQRRKTSGSRRKASGSLFHNPNDQIYEEPDEPRPATAPPSAPTAAVDPPRPSPLPLRMRRNPFTRFQSVKGNNNVMPRSQTDPVIPVRRFDRYEIQNNEPTQSRNAAYTLNRPQPKPDADAKSDAENEPAPKIKDGKEIRSDELRAATGFSLKNRSAKLPTPTMVSDSPGRPIVSFQKDWNVIELKEEKSAIDEPVKPRPLPKATTTPAGEAGMERPPSRSAGETGTDRPPSRSATSSAERPPSRSTASPFSGRSNSPALRFNRPDTQPASPLRKVNTPALPPNPYELPSRSKTPVAATTNPYELPSRSKTPIASTTATTPSISVMPPVPSISVSESPAPSKGRFAKTASMPSVPTISVSETPSPPVPSISVSESPATGRGRFNKPTSMSDIPTIAVSETPSISVTGSPGRGRFNKATSMSNIPTISVGGVPSISVGEATQPARGRFNKAPSMSNIPTIAVNDPPSNRHSSHTPSARPLPDPAQYAKQPFGRGASSRTHWTPTAVVRNGALCTQCALPIAGRTVSAAGLRFHPECFACYQCGEKLECIAFYPEPDGKHAERCQRIRARQAGVDLPFLNSHPTPDDMARLEAEDGIDPTKRFFCALDFHELFSPRCKSCKTPIEGEVIVACGAEWHAGHFFCAQCGDPFDSTTPFVEKEGYAWCVGCHTNRYSAKCKGCRKPVTDTVVKALGAEWHQGCFCCMECSGPFEDGRYFLRGESQDPVCVRCEERRLKA